MKYMLLITTFALSLALPAHAMELETFNTLFTTRYEPRSSFMPPTLTEKINVLFEEARAKKETLLQVQQIIQEKKAAGILNHILIFGSIKLGELKANQEPIDSQLNQLRAQFQGSLLSFIDEKEAQCKADIVRTEIALESRFGIFTSIALKSLITHWNEAYDSLQIPKLPQEEKDLFALLLQKEPVQIEELSESINAMQKKD